MKVAIVHDWLITCAGAEKVLEQIIAIFPDADLFSLVDFLPSEQREVVHNKYVHTSFVQKLPMAKSKYRNYLPLMPLAVEQFDLSAYNLVISSSHSVAKGVLTGPDQLHLCYCHSPMRYAWDLQHQYLSQTGLNKRLTGVLARKLLHYLRLWDLRTSNGVNHFIANSKYIARRIWKTYRRKATVVYPPVNVHEFTLKEEKEDFYLTASRMVPYKRMDLIVKAFSKLPNKKLIVIGNGPDFKKIRTMAGSNTIFLGYQPFEILREYLQRARAFVFAAEEDFGILPLEAQACGTPVIAFGKGGVKETVHGLDSPVPTGVFFAEQAVCSLLEAIEKFETGRQRISPLKCRENALRFSPERFRQRFLETVAKHLLIF